MYAMIMFTAETSVKGSTINLKKPMILTVSSRYPIKMPLKNVAIGPFNKIAALIAITSFERLYNTPNSQTIQNIWNAINKCIGTVSGKPDVNEESKCPTAPTIAPAIGDINMAAKNAGIESNAIVEKILILDSIALIDIKSESTTSLLIPKFLIPKFQLTYLFDISKTIIIYYFYYTSITCIKLPKFL